MIRLIAEKSANLQHWLLVPQLLEDNFDNIPLCNFDDEPMIYIPNYVTVNFVWHGMTGAVTANHLPPNIDKIPHLIFPHGQHSIVTCSNMLFV